MKLILKHYFHFELWAEAHKQLYFQEKIRPYQPIATKTKRYINCQFDLDIKKKDATAIGQYFCKNEVKFLASIFF